MEHPKEAELKGIMRAEFDADNPNYQSTIMRAGAGSASRACRRCGSLVQVADFDLHTQFHSDQDKLFSAIHQQIHQLNNFIDFMEPDARRRYYQRENLNTVTKELEVQKQFPNARVYREGA